MGRIAAYAAGFAGTLVLVAAGAARADGPHLAQLGLERLVPGVTRDRAAPPPPSPIQDGVPFTVRFPGAARGLEAGAAVEINGVRVGAVRGVGLDYEVERNRLVVLVDMEVQPSLLPAIGGRRARTAEEAYAIVDTLVRNGMRARVAGTRPLVGGESVIVLEIAGGAPEASAGLTVRGAGAAPEVPASPSRADDAAERLEALLERLSRVPVETMVADLQEALAALRALATGPELRDALAGLKDGAAELRAQVARIGARADPVVVALSETVRTANRTIDRATQTLASVERQLGDRSPLLAEAHALLREAGGAARSMRLMADYLERNPDALIRGKSDSRR